MIGIELTANPVTGGSVSGTSGGLGARVVAEAMRRGVWVYPAGDGHVPDALLIGPPFTITDAEMDRVVTVVTESIATVYGD